MFMSLTRLMGGVVLLAAVLALPGCGYNDLQGLDEDTKAAWSEVINQYQRRADLIPNLVNTVKGYAAHEKETLESVVQARAKATSVQVTPELLKDEAAFKKFQEAQQGLSSALGRLLALAENYPNLKADQGFRDLQSQLEGTENRITVARKRYIDKVAEFNKMVRYFPTNLTAKFLLHLEEKANFTVADEKAVAKPPEVNSNDGLVSQGAIAMRLMGRTGWGLLIGSLWLTGVASLPAAALDVPLLSGRIVDQAHALPPAVAERLSADLAAHEANTSNQVAVLIIPSLEGEPLFDFSHRVATAWKLGRKGTDNGVLLLVSIKDRKIRIEVGYGLEGVLTDARSAQIIRNEIVPRFRAGDVPAGVTAGVQAILQTIEGTYRAPEHPTATPSSSDAFATAAFAVILGVVVGLFFSRAHRVLGPVVGGGLSFLAAPWVIPAVMAGAVSLVLVGLLSKLGSSSGSRRRGDGSAFDGTWFSTQQGGWGSGGFGGSFGGSGGFSGGGGDFGGGGASGDW